MRIHPVHPAVFAGAARAQHSRLVLGLSALIAVLAAIATGAGVFLSGGDGELVFTTVRGDAADLYGRGLYQHDTVFAAAGYRAVDLVTLVLGIPALAGAAVWYRRGSTGGALLLAGVLTYFLYLYASMALGAAYNNLFLIYVGLFAASLFALAAVMTALDREALARCFAPGAPYRLLARFMFACGLVTAVVWTMPLVTSLVSDEPPKHLDSATTMVTFALDLAIITPATLVAGVMLLRRRVLGYVVASPLLVLIILLAPGIVASTVNQWRAGVSFSAGEMIGPVAGFTVLGAVAAWLIAAVLHTVEGGRAQTERP